MDDRGLEKRQSFLKFPGETPEVDYKEGIALKKDDPFTLKLIKHIIGMANAGGGYIVIGYRENENRHPEAISLAAKVVASYDPSKLAEMVEKHIVGTEKIGLTIHKDAHPDNKLVYPIIEIKGFEKKPFFCSKTTIGNELQEGAIYFRISSARTVKVASPNEWDQLIDLCIERKQADLIKRVTSLISEMGLIASIPKKDSKNTEFANSWMLQAKEQVESIIKRNELKPGGLEIKHWIISHEKTWGQKELLEAAEKAVQRNTGWPIGLVSNHQQYRPTAENNGIRAEMSDNSHGIDFWILKQKGDFYFYRAFEENRRIDNPSGLPILWFNVRIWRVVESIDHCIALYQALGVSMETKVMLCINHEGLKDRILSAEGNRAYSMNYIRVSSSDTTTWSREISLDLLKSERDKIVADICKKLFLLYEFWEPAPNIIPEIIREYDSSRL